MMENTYHVISNTHWDREWRFPFQRNRQMLVDMIDKVLEILENEPDYRAFHLDSQSIVLRDYVEIKPQNKERIIKLTKENRLLHGPWYILPEEFQVGGENLVRNLLLGHKVSKEFGGVSKIGYSPFSWGQISQLPQIYKQFNINLIMFYRGINSEDSPKAEFLWKGADGTEMISSRFSTMPRYNFYFYIYRPVAHNEGFYDVEYNWKKETTAFHFADKNQQDEDYFIISNHSEYYPENLEKQVKKIIEDQADDFTTSHKIWMEGHDSSGPNVQTAQMIKDIRTKMPDINVIHSTLEEYAKAIETSADRESLKLVSGERRSAQNNNRCGNLFGYTTSARMYLKQVNFDAERWIQYYAEPFNVFSSFTGRDINDQYPETAWELIIQNSAHDSVGGCSLDRIHEDMMMRYKHSIEISKGIFERSLKHSVKDLNTGFFPSANNIPQNEQIYITAVNPLNYKRSECVEAFIDVPLNLDKGNIEIYSAGGKKMEYELIERSEIKPVLEQMINRPMYLNMVRYKVIVQLNEIPQNGMKAFHIKPVVETFSDKKDNSITEFILENDYLKVEINRDGTLNITDKQRNHTYKDTAFFSDLGDGGHAWVNEPVGKEYSTKNSDAKIYWIRNTALQQEIEIKHSLQLPINIEERKSGAPVTEMLEIKFKVTLSKGSRYLEFNIDVNNPVESHRLRMMFPSNLKAASSFGEGQFDVVERTLERPDTSNWIEQPMYDFPMHHFVDITDGDKGMAVLVDGLKEYEVLQDEQKTLAITLFRTFEYKINPAAPQDYSYEKGAQMLGKSAYRLAFYPHNANWDKGQVFKEANKFNYDLRLVQSGALKGNAAAEKTFFTLSEEKLIVSSVKKPEEFEKRTFIVRIYNPTDRPLNGNFLFYQNITEVSRVNLEEIFEEKIEIKNNNMFVVRADSRQILSYKVKY